MLLCNYQEPFNKLRPLRIIQGTLHLMLEALRVGAGLTACLMRLLRSVNFGHLLQRLTRTGERVCSRWQALAKFAVQPITTSVLLLLKFSTKPGPGRLTPKPMRCSRYGDKLEVN